MNNNYILARWRDAITDPPEHIKNVIIRQKEKDDAVGYWSLTYCQWHDLFGESFEVEPGDQWLDVTDEPAVPRAKVQAAVDEMQQKADNAILGTPQVIAAIGIRGSLGCIAHHTDITPTESTGTSVDRVLTEI